MKNKMNKKKQDEWELLKTREVISWLETFSQRKRKVHYNEL